MEKIILITRYGGLGDLVMILPTLAELRTKFFSEYRFFLRTYKDYAGYLDHLFDKVLLDDNRFSLYPAQNLGLNINILEKDNTFAKAGALIRHYNFHGVIETSFDCHGVAAFAKAAQLIEKPFKCLDMEDQWVPQLDLPTPLKRNKKIVIQLRPNQDGRGLEKNDMPTEILNHPEVLLIDGPLEPFEYINTIGSANAFIGPDSSGLHLAKALRVPNILGLYNLKFPPEIRAYPGVKCFVDKDGLKKEMLKMLDQKECPLCGSTVTDKKDVYWMCPECDVWFQNPMPPKMFEALEEKGEDGRSKGHQQPESDLKASAHLARCFAHNWISKIPKKPGRECYKTLDIGCKYPYFSHILKKEFGVQSYGIDGMDFDSDQEPILSKYSAELDVPMLMVDFEKTTSTQILAHTIDKGRFDALSMIHVFEHMYEPLEALVSLRKLIRDVGYFLVRVPSHEVQGMEYHMTPRHYSIHPFFYSEKAFCKLIEKSGLFEIVETYPMFAGTRDYILKPT